VKTRREKLAYLKAYRAKRTPEEREKANAAMKEWRIAHPEALDRYEAKRKAKGNEHKSK